MGCRGIGCRYQGERSGLGAIGIGGRLGEAFLPTLGLANAPPKSWPARLCFPSILNLVILPLTTLSNGLRCLNL